jgi:cytochrome c oxidase subunit 3
MAVRFFVLAVLLLGLAETLTLLAPGWPQLTGRLPGTPFPPAFALSTACLLCGSWALTRAQMQIARERQREFRGSLRTALVAGTCFVAVQSYALLYFFRQQSPVEAATGATQFVAVAAALHGLHFLVAWLFLLFVVLQAYAGRYDHEYHWGVTFCGWFWHALLLVWLVVLCVMAIANQGLIDDGVMPDLN